MAPITSTNSNERHCATCKCTKPANEGRFLICSRCKTASYCGKECQAEDWEGHKDACKAAKNAAKEAAKKAAYEAKITKTFASMGMKTQTKPETLIYAGEAICITPIPFPHGKGGIGYQVHPQLRLPPGSHNYPWTDLEMSKVLGFPLRLIGSPLGDTTLPNEQAELLAIEPDPKSPKFGNSRFDGHARGGIAVVRVDGEELHMNQLDAMIKYITENQKIMKTTNDLKPKKALAEKLLTPAAFAKAFERIKAKESAESEQARVIWKNVECPLLCKSILQASRRHENGCVRKVLPARYQELTDMFSAFVITLEVNGEGYQTSISACNIGDKHGSHPLFIELLISRVLGFPLGVSRHPQMGSPVPNTIAEMLSVDPDHESSTFGQPLKQPGATGTGGLIVARRDGRQLHFFHVSAFVNYVSIIAIELKMVKQREKAGEIVDRQEIKNRLLTPAAFKEGFRRFKEKQMVLVSEQERKVLEKVECPV
ncbi:hypothetical protein LTS10_006685 [Elasticomyces elasticus]|nr:hypothetical protein LTS10_006685 [Elasticomyces elasticus]